MIPKHKEPSDATSEGLDTPVGEKGVTCWSDLVRGCQVMTVASGSTVGSGGREPITARHQENNTLLDLI